MSRSEPEAHVCLCPGERGRGVEPRLAEIPELGGLTTMLHGVGADILLIDRMRRCIDSPSFLSRTFTESELTIGKSRSDQGTYLAEVFSGKEAVFKCLGMRASELRSWLNIEIVDDEEAQPEVRLNGPVATLAQTRGIAHVLLSFSSDTDYVVAFAAAVRGIRDGD